MKSRRYFSTMNEPRIVKSLEFSRAISSRCWAESQRNLSKRKKMLTPSSTSIWKKHSVADGNSTSKSIVPFDSENVFPHGEFSKTNADWTSGKFSFALKISERKFVFRVSTEKKFTNRFYSESSDGNRGKIVRRRCVASEVLKRFRFRNENASIGDRQVQKFFFLNKNQFFLMRKSITIWRFIRWFKICKGIFKVSTDRC